jgi:hypothetical protein
MNPEDGHELLVRDEMPPAFPLARNPRRAATLRAERDRSRQDQYYAKMPTFRHLVGLSMLLFVFIFLAIRHLHGIEKVGRCEEGVMRL